MTVCASCGTEVDQDAIFCPACGQPIRAGAQPELPPAPDWPAPPPRPAEPTAAGHDVAVEKGYVPPDAAGQEPFRAEPAPAGAQLPPAEQPYLAGPPDVAQPPDVAAPPGLEPPPEPAPPPVQPPAPEAPADVPPWRRGVAFRPTPLPPPDTSMPPPAETAGSPRPPAVADPFGPAGIIVLPETIAGWLTTLGAVVGVLALFLPWREGFGYTASWGLASGINLLVGIALLALLVVLLAPHWVPAIPRRDLAIAAIGLVGVGIGLDRLGLPLTGMGATVFLIGMILVAGGGLIAELSLDRPTGGTRR